MSKRQLTFLCVSCEYKGVEFLTYCKAAGNRVLLLTGEDERNKPWPHESIDEIFYIQSDIHCLWDEQELRDGMAYLMSRERIDRIIALDDFDVERVAVLREEFRIPGMGRTTAAYFRDKLSMRMQAKEAGIPVPDFTSLFHDDNIKDFISRTEAPWILKPRKDAGAMGIEKLQNEKELWQVLNRLGNRRYKYLIETFKPGQVYHVDSISSEGKILFTRVSKYLTTPFQVTSGGGIFRSMSVEYGQEEDKALRAMNTNVMKAFGMKHSASHSEFIRGADGEFYFLETSSRVGGANLAYLVEAASGMNLWGEWANLEVALAHGETYQLPKTRRGYGGIIASLSRYESTDYSLFDDPEICWKLDKPYHIGMVIQSDNQARIQELLDKYADIIQRDFTAKLPPKGATFG